jgi:hypothetical protein
VNDSKTRNSVNDSKAHKQKKASDVTASKPASAKAAELGTKAAAGLEVGLPQVTVRERAYELHIRRGGEHGHDQDDWLRAEQEILEQYAELDEWGSDR